MYGRVVTAGLVDGLRDVRVDKWWKVEEMPVFCRYFCVDAFLFPKCCLKSSVKQSEV